MKAFPSMTGAVGMELRDYFAAKALPLAMNWMEHNYKIELQFLKPDWKWNMDESDAQEIAEIAYHLADAMMAEREKA